jgi:type IV secretory pathway component VirB8
MDIEKKLVDLESKIDNIYITVEKTRKYIWWTMVVTVAVIVIPLIAMIFVIPSFLNSITNIGSLGL